MIFRNRIAHAAPGSNPRHVEAFLRYNQPGGWLDDLSTEEMTAELRLAAVMAATAGPFVAERLAQTFGMHPTLVEAFTASVDFFPTAGEQALADEVCAEANRLDAAHYHVSEAAEGCL